MVYSKLDSHFTVDDVAMELYPEDAPLGGTQLKVMAIVFFVQPVSLLMAMKMTTNSCEQK